MIFVTNLRKNNYYNYQKSKIDCHEFILKTKALEKMVRIVKKQQKIDSPFKGCRTDCIGSAALTSQLLIKPMQR